MTTATKPEWISIREAAEYLDVGEPTIYRWMKDGKITFRKVGDSTRFLKADLDAVVQIFPSRKDESAVRELCPVCHHDDLVVGHVQSTGLNYFKPAQTKFWTLKTTNIDLQAKMCTRCGAVSWYGDTQKLLALRPSGSDKKDPKSEGEEIGEKEKGSK